MKFEGRNNYIGGSDFAVVMGISPFKKRIELVLEKAGVLANTFEGNFATRRGEQLENTVIKLFEEETKLVVSEKQAVYKKQIEDCLLLLCHIDGMTSNNAVFEAKTTDYKSKSWDDGIPDYYQAQLEFNMFLSGKQTAYISVAFCNGEDVIDFKTFVYERKLTDDFIINQCKQFTADVIKFGTMGVVNNGQIVGSNYAKDELVKRYQEIEREMTRIKEQLKPLEAEKKEIEAVFKQDIQNNWGIDTGCYQVFLGNRITQPSSDYKISRSLFKVVTK